MKSTCPYCFDSRSKKKDLPCSKISGPRLEKAPGAEAHVAEFPKMFVEEWCGRAVLLYDTGRLQRGTGRLDRYNGN